MAAATARRRAPRSPCSDAQSCNRRSWTGLVKGGPRPTHARRKNPADRNAGPCKNGSLPAAPFGGKNGGCRPRLSPLRPLLDKESAVQILRLSVCVRLLALLAFPLLAATPAAAQATRTWVSGVGDDVNPCSRTAPCKTFAGAISKTAAGGEINALDPGGFGQLTITKAITIDGGGVLASVLSSGVNGIVINAAVSDTVTLRNIVINGVRQTATPGNIGIRILQAANVHIENCRIFGFNARGISIETSINSN